MFGPARNVPYVLALTLLEGDGPITRDTRIRICVRSASVNRTHPDTVSVPTQRIPAVLAEDMLGAESTKYRLGNTQLFSRDSVSSESQDGHDPVIYAVEALLSAKLGVSSALENGRLAFNASLAGLEDGAAIYPELESKEELRMLNLLVRVVRGSESFPAHTASYSTSRWVSVARFIEMWEGKDVTKVGVSARDALRGVCVHGLCISSTYDILWAHLKGERPKLSRPVELGVG